MSRPATAARFTGLLMLSALALAGTVAVAAPKRAKGPDWAAARTAFASASRVGARPRPVGMTMVAFRRFTASGTCGTR